MLHKKFSELIENIPAAFEPFLTRIPFSWRLGPLYKKIQAEISVFNRLSDADRKNYIFERVKNIVDIAYRTNKFYFDFYNKNNFSPDMLTCFDD